jgi:hypothetical protein
MENPVRNDREVLIEAITAIDKAQELFDAGDQENALDLYMTVRKAVREQFSQSNLLGPVN